MSTYTKEQLIARINQVTAINKYRISRDTDAEGLVMDNELLAIALASLYAEPVHQFIYNNPYEEGYTEWLDCNKDYFNGVPEDCRRILYTAQPAPVSVPDNKSITQHFDTIALETAREIMCDVNRRQEFLGGDVQLLSRIQCRIDDACRAAMLQGAYGNSPVVPDGWIPLSERLPENKPGSYEYIVFETLNNRAHHDYWNVPDKGDDEFTPFWNHYDRYVTHWMPLPAAPQQEDL